MAGRSTQDGLAERVGIYDHVVVLARRSLLLGVHQVDPPHTGSFLLVLLGSCQPGESLSKFSPYKNTVRYCNQFFVYFLFFYNKIVHLPIQVRNMTWQSLSVNFHSAKILPWNLNEDLDCFALFILDNILMLIFLTKVSADILTACRSLGCSDFQNLGLFTSHEALKSSLFCFKSPLRQSAELSESFSSSC